MFASRAMNVIQQRSEGREVRNLEMQCIHAILYLIKRVQLVHRRPTVPQSVEDVNAVQLTHFLGSIRRGNGMHNFLPFVLSIAASRARRVRR